MYVFHSMLYSGNSSFCFLFLAYNMSVLIIFIAWAGTDLNTDGWISELLSIGAGRFWKGFSICTAMILLWSIEISSVITFSSMATKGKSKLVIWALLQFSANLMLLAVLVWRTASWKSLIIFQNMNMKMLLISLIISSPSLHSLPV